VVKKAPRRTAERIVEVALELFNRFGEPNVSTTLISAELRISPGNLYYHFPAKDELINALFDRFENSLNELLHASADVKDVEDAWFFMHSLFELIWQYSFLYRDLNDLLSKNRRLETQVQKVLHSKTQALQTMLDNMRRSGTLQMDAAQAPSLATNLVVVLSYWLSFEYASNPREALEPANAQAALLRGAQHALSLLAPYLPLEQRAHMLALMGAYTTPVNSSFIESRSPHE
jgi:AcrR family transcriptional regulator